MKPKPKPKRLTHAKAFAQEIKCWRLDRETDALLRAFCAYVAIRMKGETP